MDEIYQAYTAAHGLGNNNLILRLLRGEWSDGGSVDDVVYRETQTDNISETEKNDNLPKEGNNNDNYVGDTRPSDDGGHVSSYAKTSGNPYRGIHKLGGGTEIDVTVSNSAQREYDYLKGIGAIFSPISDSNSSNFADDRVVIDDNDENVNNAQFKILVNNLPILVHLETQSINENNAAATIVGRLDMAGSNIGDAIELKVVNDSRFVIEKDPIIANRFFLKTTEPLNYETLTDQDLITPGQQIRVTLQASNPAFTTSKNFAVLVTVDDVNDEPTNITLSALTVNENADGATIGKLIVADEDFVHGETFTFKIYKIGTVQEDPRFLVDNVNGEYFLKLKPGQSLNYEDPININHQIPLSIIATDSGGLSTPLKDFNLSILDKNEKPQQITLSNNMVDLYTPGSVIGVLSISGDPDNPGGVGNPNESYQFSMAESLIFEIIYSDTQYKLKLKEGVSLSGNFSSANLSITVKDTYQLDLISDPLEFSYILHILPRNNVIILPIPIYTAGTPEDLILATPVVQEETVGAFVSTIQMQGIIYYIQGKYRIDVYKQNGDELDARFKVVEQGGGYSLSLKDNGKLDYETLNPKNIDIVMKVVDTSNNTVVYTEGFSINVLDYIEPFIITGAPITINDPINSVFYKTLDRQSATPQGTKSIKSVSLDADMPGKIVNFNNNNYGYFATGNFTSDLMTIKGVIESSKDDSATPTITSTPFSLKILKPETVFLGLVYVGPGTNGQQGIDGRSNLGSPSIAASAFGADAEVEHATYATTGILYLANTLNAGKGGKGGAGGGVLNSFQYGERGGRGGDGGNIEYTYDGPTTAIDQIIIGGNTGEAGLRGESGANGSVNGAVYAGNTNAEGFYSVVLNLNADDVVTYHPGKGGSGGQGGDIFYTINAGTGNDYIDLGQAGFSQDGSQQGTVVYKANGGGGNDYFVMDALPRTYLDTLVTTDPAKNDITKALNSMTGVKINGDAGDDVIDLFVPFFVGSKYGTLDIDGGTGFNTLMIHKDFMQPSSSNTEFIAKDISLFDHIHNINLIDLLDKANITITEADIDKITPSTAHSLYIKGGGGSTVYLTAADSATKTSDTVYYDYTLYDKYQLDIGTTLYVQQGLTVI